MNYRIKLLHLQALLLFITHVGICQTKSEGGNTLKARIIALDKAGWESWKNKKADWFELNTTTDFVSISADGVISKTEVIKATANDCDIKSYALCEIRFIQLTENSVLLTYIAAQEGECTGIKIPSKIRVSANYIYQNKKWLEAFYMESKMDSLK